ncbi:hypothetical protein DHX103_03740 [Planococcus sp. X10-3]|uniref:hypothetical protein n=1 Tax=Planococcus sp. X10-3 TaxID=3061240 RepID=UPI003BAFFBB8
MNNKYGIISITAGAVAIFSFTFLAGIISMVTAYFGLRAVADGSTSIESRKSLYFCMIGLILTILAFLLHSYIF